ncbi:putative poly [Penaeus vannamei]|uniref:NAD(+) ADP-ribosyltransferase n=1 Tax=Penaeus vannamei TaxID=6689 RepID=A0A3R7PNU5_PENVA|nr:putative poly [Penaeus vannamei]
MSRQNVPGRSILNVLHYRASGPASTTASGQRTRRLFRHRVSLRAEGTEMATQNSIRKYLKVKKPRGDRKKLAAASEPEQARGNPAVQAASQAKSRRVHPAVRVKYPNAVVLGDNSCLLIQVSMYNEKKEKHENINKFYVIQALENEGKYYLFTGNQRVGYPTKTAKFQGKKDREDAIKAYQESFRDKVGKRNRGIVTNFACGVYTLLEMDEDEDQETDGSKYSPLGKLSPAQVERGREALRKIEDAIGKQSEAELRLLSCEYYTYIPHKFEMRVPPTLIKDRKGVEDEKEYLKNMLQAYVKEESHSESGESDTSDSSAEPDAAGSRATVINVGVD